MNTTVEIPKTNRYRIWYNGSAGTFHFASDKLARRAAIGAKKIQKEAGGLWLNWNESIQQWDSDEIA